jgi:NAD(P)-dependent dehydrogenase (short-subunit alcohol dehydrogenase family)
VPLSSADVLTCIEVLETLAVERVHLLEIEPGMRKRLLEAAGRVNTPAAFEHRQFVKARRRKDRATRRARDAEIVGATAMRQVRSLPVYVALPGPGSEETAALPAASVDAPVAAPVVAPVDAPVDAGATAAAAPEFHADELAEPRSCYVCKRDFRRVHFFYDSMCPTCAKLNYKKRTQTARLDGRVALITGARIKIGFQAALMMLRAGATVVVSTRFAHDAALRFAREPDYAAWRERLEVHGLDLRHTPSVELFARHLAQTLPRLDLLINNAAQTVRRPTAFYAHLVEQEEAHLDDLPAAIRPVLAKSHELRRRLAGEVGGHAVVGSENGLMTWQGQKRGMGLIAAARLSQLPCTPEDLADDEALFPIGHLDADLQQVDLRRHNSWRMTADEVATAELLEVHLVNAVAPFVLVRELTALMRRDRTDEKHIVNVSAMEASFSRKKKTDKHPHTNMAKAALNMLTRTSAADYAEYGIWMNSVDTGWVTDEDPMHHVERKQRDHDFYPPLDVVDGAARVCDPFFSGLSSGVHVFGKFFKDYTPTGW